MGLALGRPLAHHRHHPQPAPLHLGVAQRAIRLVKALAVAEAIQAATAGLHLQAEFQAIAQADQAHPLPLGAVPLLALQVLVGLVAVLAHQVLHPVDLLVRPDRLLAGPREQKLKKMISVVLFDSAFQLLSNSREMFRHE